MRFIWMRSESRESRLERARADENTKLHHRKAEHGSREQPRRLAQFAGGRSGAKLRMPPRLVARRRQPILRKRIVDSTTFLALAERCAPGSDPKPLAAIVRQASGYEPLSLRFDGGPGGSTKLLASDRSEAIQLASELVIAGHRVRVGLAGIDTRDLDRLGVTIADAFEPCGHLKAAARLMTEDPGRLKPSTSSVRAEARPGVRTPQPPGPAPPSPSSAQPQSARAWDVYGQGRLSSALVYGGPD